MNTIRKSCIALSMLLLTTSFASALDRRVEVNNATSFDIHYLQMSNKGSKSWEEDVLGADRILPSGGSIVVNVDDGSGYCIYDFRGTFEDGNVATKFGVNVCEATSFTFVE